jgi:hypothetical protein
MALTTSISGPGKPGHHLLLVCVLLLLYKPCQLQASVHRPPPTLIQQHPRAAHLDTPGIYVMLKILLSSLSTCG